jgi:hypothetical protein
MASPPWLLSSCFFFLSHTKVSKINQEKQHKQTPVKVGLFSTYQTAIPKKLSLPSFLSIFLSFFFSFFLSFVLSYFFL